MAGNGFIDGGDGWSTKGGKGSQGKGGYDGTCWVWSQQWNGWMQLKGKGKGKENDKGKGKGKQAGGGGKAGGGSGPKPAVVQCLNRNCGKFANGNGITLAKWTKAFEEGAPDDKALTCKFCEVKFDQEQAVCKEYLHGKGNPKKVGPGAKAKGAANLELPPTPEDVKKIFEDEDLKYLHSRLVKLPGVETGMPVGWQEVRDKVMAGTTNDPAILAMLDYMVPIPGVLKPRAEINQMTAKVTELRAKKTQAEQKLVHSESKLAKGAIAIREANERQQENEKDLNENQKALKVIEDELREACSQREVIMEKVEIDAKKITFYPPATSSQEDEDMEDSEDEVKARDTLVAQLTKAAEEQCSVYRAQVHADYVKQFAIEMAKLKAAEKPTEVTMGAYVSPAFTLNSEKTKAAVKESQKSLRAARKATAAGGVKHKPKTMGSGTPAQVARQAFEDAEGSKARMDADAAAALEMNSEL